MKAGKVIIFPSVKTSFLYLWKEKESNSEHEDMSFFLYLSFESTWYTDG